MTDELIHEICTCGRYRQKPHCPTCGSYQANAFTRKETVNRGNQHIEHIRAYRCRMCALIFNDDDRAHCQAPLANITGRVKWAGRPRPTTWIGRQVSSAGLKSIEDVPEAMRNRMDEIKKLKDEGKW